MVFQHNSGKSQTILVVDDDPDIATVMAEVLALAGYRVRMANTGSDGLRIALEERPDLIVLDVILTDMSGSDFVTTYRKLTPPEHRAAVVFTTAHADAARIATDSGADGLLVKPFDIDALVDCVQRTLSHHARAA